MQNNTIELPKKRFLVTVLDFIDSYGAGWFGTIDPNEGPRKWRADYNWLLFPREQEKELCELKETLDVFTPELKPILIEVKYQEGMKMVALPNDTLKIKEFAKKALGFISESPYSGPNQDEGENFKENFKKTFF